MNREDFYEYLEESYDLGGRAGFSMLHSILRYAEKLPKSEQHKFLSEMLDFIEEEDIKKANL